MNTKNILEVYDFSENVNENCGFKYKYKYGKFTITTNKIMTLDEIKNDSKQIDKDYIKFLNQSYCNNDLKYVKEKLYDEYAIEFQQGRKEYEKVLKLDSFKESLDEPETKTTHEPKPKDKETLLKEKYVKQYENEERIYVNTIGEFNDVMFKYLDVRLYLEFLNNGAGTQTTRHKLEVGNIIYSIQPLSRKYECIFRVDKIDNKNKMITANPIKPKILLTYKYKKQNKLNLVCYEEWNQTEDEFYIPFDEVIEHYNGEKIYSGTFMKVFYGY